MAFHNDIGKKGEKLAVDFLRKAGYRIVCCNWRYRKKEIDIIAYDDELLIIVEVKLRSTDYFGDPSEFVTKKKQRFLIEAAGAYLETIKEAPEVRFDIVSIIAGNNGYKFDHITDAFNP
jgi:putative endonuclease